MVDEPDSPHKNGGAGSAPAAKKVAKRVVKKAVVRPSPPPAKTIRYGRPVSPTRTTPQAKVVSRPGAKPVGATKARPRIQVGKAIGTRGTDVASGLAGAAGSAGRATGAFLAGRFRALLAWRIPHLDSRLACLITGVLVGLVAVGLGLIALEIFSELRGVSSGGGRWGSLTFVVVTFISIVLGDLLLTAFGTARAGLISFLAVVLTLVAILGLFLELADSHWALLLVPALGAATYFASHWLITLADSSPAVAK